MKLTVLFAKIAPAASAIATVMSAGVMCQKQKSSEPEPSKEAIRAKRPVNGSTMMAGKAMAINTSMKKTYTAAMSMRSETSAERR